MAAAIPGFTPTLRPCTLHQNACALRPLHVRIPPKSSERETFACVSHARRQAEHPLHMKRAGYCGVSDIQAEPMPRGTQYPRELHERAVRVIADIGAAGAVRAWPRNRAQLPMPLAPGSTTPPAELGGRNGRTAGQLKEFDRRRTR